MTDQLASAVSFEQVISPCHCQRDFARRCSSKHFWPSNTPLYPPPPSPPPPFQTYHYLIDTSMEHDPTTYRFCMHHREPLDVSLIRQVAALLQVQSNCPTQQNSVHTQYSTLQRITLPHEASMLMNIQLICMLTDLSACHCRPHRFVAPGNLVIVHPCRLHAAHGHM